MPAFLLRPTKLTGDVWDHSEVRVACVVEAPDEQAARAIAAIAFMPENEREIARSFFDPPWEDEGLVESSLAEHWEGSHGEFPAVYVPRTYREIPHGGRRKTPSLGDFTEWVEYPRSKYYDRAVTYLMREGYLTYPTAKGAVADQNTVARHIIEQPKLYRAKASALLGLLNDLDEGNLRTAGNDDPLLGTVEPTTELSELLREVRDELRRFNNLLETDLEAISVEQASASLGSKLIDGARTLATSTFGKGVQACLAPVVVFYMLQFAMELGFPEPDENLVARLTALIK